MRTDLPTLVAAVVKAQATVSQALVAHVGGSSVRPQGPAGASLAGRSGILHADPILGFGEFYERRRDPKPVTRAGRMGDGKFFALRQASLASEKARGTRSV